METIVLEKPGQFLRTETEAPSSAPEGHALIRIHRVGICGTDMHAFRGRQPFFSYPRILGHELGVEVLEVGDNDRGIQVGDRCSVEPYLYCRNCLACRAGRTNCCEKLQVLGVHTDGGMRERIVVPISTLHRSEKLELEQLALVETLGIGCHAVDRSGLSEGENALVIGAGPIGLSVIQFAKIAGAKLAVLDLSDDRRAFASRQFGIEHTLDGSRDVPEALRDAFGGELPTVVFDATGNPKSMMASFKYPAQGGRLVFVGLVLDDITFHDPEFHRRELTLLASRNSTARDFKRIISLMESGDVDTGPWITHRAASSELIETFESWLDPKAGVVKAMLEF